MGQKYAAYNTQGAIIAFYDSVDSPVPDGAQVIEITDTEWQACLTSQAYTVSNGKLTAPLPATSDELAQEALVQSARSMLASGLEIVSTGTPALNGVYAVNQLSQSDIIAIETSLNAGKGFPGGAVSLNYPDSVGALHQFSEANFTDFATAVRDFVYACRSVIAGQSTTLPPTSIRIA